MASDTLDFLDSLIGTAGSIYSTNAAQKAAQAQQDAQAVKPVASAQVSLGGSGSTFIWLGVGLVVIVGAVMLLRR